MLRASKLVVALLLGVSAGRTRPSTPGGVASGDAAAKPAHSATSKNAAAGNEQPTSEAATDIPFREVDSENEQRMLELVNQARAQAAAPRLTLDTGLSHAARLHAEAMVAAGQLSHRFVGEPSLQQRLAATSSLLLEQSGENVAFDYNVSDAHQHLMLSPHHRANLLNPVYNVVGLSLVRSGDRLYVVQDFGRALPNYSLPEVKDRIAAAVARARRNAKQPNHARRDLLTADNAACSMAQADKLGTSPVHQLVQRYTVLTYTSLHPDLLPASADRAIASRDLRSLSIGACNGRTPTYPTGAYWVVVALE